MFSVYTLWISVRPWLLLVKSENVWCSLLGGLDHDVDDVLSFFVGNNANVVNVRGYRTDRLECAGKPRLRLGVPPPGRILIGTWEILDLLPQVAPFAIRA